MISVRKVGVALALVGFAVIHAADSAPVRRYRERAPDELAPVDWNAKRVALDIRAKPWPHVLRWFAQVAQMQIITKGEQPDTVVNFYSVDKDGKPREYSLSETFDILNEMLMAEYGYLLIRGERALALLSVDEDIPAELIPRVTLEELKSPRRARTEVVEVIFTLRGNINAAEFAPQAKRLLGACGRATPVDGNQLILIGTVGSLQRNLYVLRGKGVGIAP